MHRAVLICALVLLILSPIKCKKKKEDDIQEKTTTTSIPTTKDQESRSEIDVINIMKECNESFRIQMSYLEQLNNSGSFPDETDKTPKCYIHCVLESSGVASEEGQFDAASAALVLTQLNDGYDTNELIDIAFQCTDRQETCKCERSYQFIKCIMEKQINKIENSK
ncbi:general odorant-binding protein 84a [Papilio machaon]|uniref:general odorant-binding protein 84a n=1 Tax=Papilio machaon TaxID=76193 RepID=UPI001E665A24|nr:general odorant-binding protein 84a [Papilio machaon]